MFQNQNQLPSSLPKNWPNSSTEDVSQCPERRIQIGRPQQYQFETNFVKTSKYEIWNFLPLFLMETFDPRNKIANCYFLIIVIFQIIPSISNTHGVPTTLFPLTVVIAVDAIFQILEDINRHKADIESNSSLTQRFNLETNTFDMILWSQVCVGDLLKVETRKNIPADMAILCVSERNPNLPTGVCYVETKSLDGETNLKIRNALSITYNKVTDQPASLKQLVGTVRMEHPNKIIDSFSGVIELNGNNNHHNSNHHHYNYTVSSSSSSSSSSNAISPTANSNKCAIQPQNILLRGCVLRNTPWIIGLVLNTGHDTKIMMSSTTTQPKHSQLEKQAGFQILRIILFLIFICFIGAIGQTIWNDLNDVQYLPYLKWNVHPGENFIISFFYFFLLHATFIPVSLYVSMSIARYCQRFFMNNDLNMYYDSLDSPSSVRTMTLNEELGQITHIFSDKTGTLTRNVMDFRKMSINGVKYGLGITEIGKSAWKLQGREIPYDMVQGEELAQKHAVPHVSFYDPLYNAHMTATAGAGGAGAANNNNYNDNYRNNNNNNNYNNNSNNNDNNNNSSNNSSVIQKEKIKEFFLTLALCHDVIPERDDVTGKITFSAPNPDDHALVCAAEYFGYAFKDRQDKRVIITQRNSSNTVSSSSQTASTSSSSGSSTTRMMGVPTSTTAAATTTTNSNNDPNNGDDRDMKIEILDMIEFTSKRKRMSVVIKDDVNNCAVLYCKGADSAILPRLQRRSTNSNTNSSSNNKTNTSSSNNNTTTSNTTNNSSSNSSSNVDSSLSSGAHLSSSSSSLLSNNNNDDDDDQELLIQKTENDIREFALEGLRVLLIAKTIIPLPQYYEWRHQYTEAKTNILEIEKRKHGDENMIETLEDFIENQLVLLGATAIEDRLQHGVSECISELIQASIKLWVLTGDKEETAINVAMACNVLQPVEYTHHIVINKSTCPTAYTLLQLLDMELQKLEQINEHHHRHHHHHFKPRSLIIDGPCLLDVMRYNHHTTTSIATTTTTTSSISNTAAHDLSLSTEDAIINPNTNTNTTAISTNRSNDLGTIYAKFLKLTSSCKAVVCCRMSPDQKREIVHMVKKDVPYARTLGIGDGANDVAMIQEAHVGVGIKGEEGVQAVNASDFAIAQFKYLSILLLKHGRYNYIRLSNLICYMFYKNVFMSMAQFWLNFQTGFSGQKYYFEIGIQMFNVLFTSFPILALAVWDMDVLPSSVVKYPMLYQDTVTSISFNNKVFGVWILTAIGESLIVAFLALIFLRNYSSHTTGPGGGDNRSNGNSNSNNNNNSTNNITASSSSFWEAGVLCFTSIVFIVNIKIFFIQTRWNYYMLFLVAVSILLWFAVAFIICSAIHLPFDYDSYMIIQHVTSSGTFWLSLLLIVGMVYAKDVWMYGVERNFNYRPNHIIAEMEVYGKSDASLLQAASTNNGSSSSNSSNNNTNTNTGNSSPLGYYFTSLTTPFLNKSYTSAHTTATNTTTIHRPRTASESSIDYLIDKQTGRHIAANTNSNHSNHVLKAPYPTSMSHSHSQPIRSPIHSSMIHHTGNNTTTIIADVVASPLHESHITMSTVKLK